ncbi:MAG: hypothetical protein R2816_10450 [Flavobacteriaceae bacterium]|nr:hypothetical protein [Flavobacteriaceae bacterium]
MILVITRKITAFVLVFILFAHNINTLVIIGDFMMNQAIIAKNLCVQKENQQGCNGKCQLRKQLKENNPESNPNNPIQESRRLTLDVFYLVNINLIEQQQEDILLSKENIITQSQKIIKMYLEIDTPPPNFS